MNTLTSADEQQALITGISCTDAVFVTRKVIENSIEYNRPAFLCFIDIQEAFDRIKLKYPIYLVIHRGILTNLIKTIQNIYLNNNVQARVNGKLTDKIAALARITK